MLRKICNIFCLASVQTGLKPGIFKNQTYSSAFSLKHPSVLFYRGGLNVENIRLWMDGLIQSGCNLEGRGRDILHRAPVRSILTGRARAAGS